MRPKAGQLSDCRESLGEGLPVGAGTAGEVQPLTDVTAAQAMNGYGPSSSLTLGSSAASRTQQKPKARRAQRPVGAILQTRFPGTEQGRW